MTAQLLKRKGIQTPEKNSKRYNELEKYRLARQWAKNHVVLNATGSIPFSQIQDNYLNFLDSILKNEQDEIKKKKQFQPNELGFFLKNYAAEHTSDDVTDISFYTFRSFQGIMYNGLALKAEL